MSEAENTSESKDTRPKTELLPLTGNIKPFYNKDKSCPKERFHKVLFLESFLLN